MSLKQRKADAVKDSLRRISLQGGNRFCFDCSLRGPVYVVQNFHIFVCTSCSAVHRSMQHKVKGISASEFTEEEVIALDVGGNDRAQKVWLARYRLSRPTAGNERKIRDFVDEVFNRQVFVDRTELNTLKEDIATAQDPQTRKDAAVAALQARHQHASAAGEEAAPLAAPTAQPLAQPPPQAPAPAPPPKHDIFDDIFGGPMPSAAPQQQPSQQQPQQNWNPQGQPAPGAYSQPPSAWSQGPPSQGPTGPSSWPTAPQTAQQTPWSAAPTQSQQPASWNATPQPPHPASQSSTPVPGWHNASLPQPAWNNASPPQQQSPQQQQPMWGAAPQTQPAQSSWSNAPQMPQQEPQQQQQQQPAWSAAPQTQQSQQPMWGATTPAAAQPTTPQGGGAKSRIQILGVSSYSVTGTSAPSAPGPQRGGINGGFDPFAM